MKKMRGDVCDFCLHPITREAVRSGRALRHLRPGHVPRLFCWTGCIQSYLNSTKGLDARTREELDAMRRRIDAARVPARTTPAAHPLQKSTA
jgi:hypothetical protein